MERTLNHMGGHSRSASHLQHSLVSSTAHQSHAFTFSKQRKPLSDHQQLHLRAPRLVETYNSTIELPNPQ